MYLYVLQIIYVQTEDKLSLLKNSKFTSQFNRNIYKGFKLTLFLIRLTDKELHYSQIPIRHKQR